MSHEVETMAYNAVQKPWHGLGTPIKENATVDEMLIAAGLNTENDSEPLYIYNAESGLYTRLEDLNKDNTPYRAIMRTSDGYVHAILTDEYKVIQNRQIMEFFREYTEAAQMSLETAGALRHGSIVWVLAKINKNFQLPGGDQNEAYLLLSSSHDGTREFNGQFTSIRVVCANTLRMADNSKRGRSFSISHSSKITPEILKQAKVQIGLASEAMEKYSESAALMAATSIDIADTFKFIAALVQPDLLESSGDVKLLSDGRDFLNTSDFGKKGKEILSAINTSPGSQVEAAKETVWGVLNGVTYYVDHLVGRSRDTALTSAWFGQGAELKSKAYKLAVEYVNR